MTWCPHDDDPRSCPPCQSPPAGRRLGKARTFVARYDGWCRACGDPIEPGDRVGYAAGAIVCEPCL